MPAPHNPYRSPVGWHEMTETRSGHIETAREHFGPELDVSHQPIGLAALDLDTMARRNYTLGRRQARRDAEGEIQDLRSQLSYRPAAAYDEGYDEGVKFSEREALEAVEALLRRPRLLAHELTTGKRADGKRLTPKQREQAVTELSAGVAMFCAALEGSLMPASTPEEEAALGVKSLAKLLLIGNEARYG